MTQVFPRHLKFVSEEEAQDWLIQHLNNKNIEAKKWTNPEYTTEWKNKHEYDIYLPFTIIGSIVIEVKKWDQVGGSKLNDLFEQIKKYKKFNKNIVCAVFIYTDRIHDLENFQSRLSGREDIIGEFLLANNIGIVEIKEYSTRIIFNKSNNKENLVI